jgi:hypothetical protein
MMKQPQPSSPAPTHRAILPILLCTMALMACQTAASAEVYTWTDENGVVHFSDAPPESGKSATLEVEEIYRPGSTDAYAKPAEPAADASADTSEAAAEPALSAAQQRREQILRERAERQQEAAEAERLCALHRQRVEQMEPARRVFYTDEQGESVRMDDDQRMALIDESKQYLARNCRG